MNRIREFLQRRAPVCTQKKLLDSTRIEAGNCGALENPMCILDFPNQLMEACVWDRFFMEYVAFSFLAIKRLRYPVRRIL